jgi:two-component system response regulator DevR
MTSGSDDRPVRVFLVDDHEIVRRGFAGLLKDEPGFEVVGEASTSEDALARIPATQPDVAVLDVRLPDGDGVAVCREIRSTNPGVRCLILTAYADEDALFAAIMAGASGYVLKQASVAELVRALKTVAAGESTLDPAVTNRVLDRLRHDADETDERIADLTRQEQRILALIADGLSNREIAEKMFLAEATVRNYVSNLLAKLGLSRRTQAAIYGNELRRKRPD